MTNVYIGYENSKKNTVVSLRLHSVYVPSIKSKARAPNLINHLAYPAFAVFRELWQWVE